MPVIPALGRLKQENHEFEATLGYIVRSCFKKTNQTNKQTKNSYSPAMKKIFLSHKALPILLLSVFEVHQATHFFSLYLKDCCFCLLTLFHR
jgi:hypothetical protein